MSQSFPFFVRAELPGTHPLTTYLLHLITIKRSNLCVSADVSTSSALLKLAEEVGDSICVLKTHADIVDDFSEKTIKRLVEVSRRKRFLLFEDRKFGDIGSTVQSQYTRGPLRICSWAHLTNAHIFPGPAIITALASAAASTLASLNRCVSTEIYAGTPRVSSDGEEGEDREGACEDCLGDNNGDGKRPEVHSGRKGSVVTATTTISQTVETATLSRSVSAGEGEDGDREEALEALGEPPLARGLLLLAEMSSEGNLMTGEYTRKCVQAAREHADFVAGFISQRSLNEMKGDNFLSFTPGVSLPPEGETEEEKGKKGDGLGQQYRTPKMVVGREGCDIIIVGRGILGATDRAKEAERYRREAWRTYQDRIKTGRRR